MKWHSSCIYAYYRKYQLLARFTFEREPNANRTRTGSRVPERELNVGSRSRSEPSRILVKFGVRVSRSQKFSRTGREPDYENIRRSGTRGEDPSTLAAREADPRTSVRFWRGWRKGMKAVRTRLGWETVRWLRSRGQS